MQRMKQTNSTTNHPSYRTSLVREGDLVEKGIREWIDFFHHVTWTE